MNDTLKKNLISLLGKHQVIFWYDAKEEFSDDFEEFEFENVKKIVLTRDNDFKVKYEILKENPESKYLLYAKFAEPKHEENWLLGIQLANDQFRTDICAVYLAELNLSSFCFEAVKAHEKFFKNEKRKNDLRKIRGYNSTPTDLEHAMLAVSAGIESYNLDEIAVVLIDEAFNSEKAKAMENIALCNLNSVLWSEILDVYRYEGSDIKDFSVFLFEDSFNRCFGLDTKGSVDAKILLSHLKNKVSLSSLNTISRYSYEQLGMDFILSEKDIKSIVPFGDYKGIDRIIVSELADRVLKGSIVSKEIQDIVTERKDLHWYPQYRCMYEGLLNALLIFERIRLFDYEMTSYRQAIQNYSARWYEVDYFYRQFCNAIYEGAIDLLSEVKTLVDNKYLNSFLRPINEEWSKYATEFIKQGWKNPLMCIKDKFWNQCIKPIINDKRTAVVIISDALRYEVGQELVSRINATNRYAAVIEPAISNVPSYTQIGMASLLPHSAMAISADGGEVTLDGQSSQGSVNREQILTGYSAGAYTAKVMSIDEALFSMNTTELRNLIRDNRIVYIYQNVIDARGENDLIKACEDAMSELERLTIKLGSSNVNTMYITADHGFLFQSQDLVAYDFIAEGSVSGSKITKTNRRFILGYGLKEIDGTTVASLSSLGYENTDGLEVAFPNSILRFRLSGADTHFVHGGLSLQEIVVPIIKVSKERADNIAYVELQMLSKPNAITTGSLSVRYYQADKITEKCRGFDAVFGIYSDDGTLLSNETRKSISSDSVEIRDREFIVNFSLNNTSDSYRGKAVSIITKQVVDNGRAKDIIKYPVVLKKSSVFELDF